ncbi:MAG TPA: cytochrome c biogenesis protein CcsA, partial [Verrucomicrobiales bacterium]|nr:cytochrome c biogenesis protein CcsA [Verrucomicrobiales bacterium]
MGSLDLQSIASEPVLVLGLAAFALLLTALPWSFWALSNGRSSSGVRSLLALSNLLLTAQLVLR